MVHGLDTVGTAIEAVSVKEDTAGFERFVAPVNYVVTIISSIALVVAAFVLSYSVASRYFFHFSTDWQDEFSVFLIAGAVFMSGAAVQARRGHVAIEAFSTLLSPRANRIRLFLVDVHRSRFALSLPGNRGSCCMKRSSKGTAPGRPGSRLWDSLFADDVRHGVAEHSTHSASGYSYFALEQARMSILSIGLLYGGSTLLVMFAGMPIAFALGAVATIFMIAFMPSSSVDTITQNVYEEMASITLLSIPLFILKGAAIGRYAPGRISTARCTPVAPDTRRARYCQRVRLCLVCRDGGVVAATCSAIGSAGIPQMRKHGYSGGFAAGISPLAAHSEFCCRRQSQ